ncbi:adenine deaminase [Coraliomargarita parva]|uniref:adenine deaminase n=1 Tax=Coraliomargarita parva TaxID=3014050 RepID=UPI0022B48F30|nr:adenine deaminase C-terminal domain-containing protein [Coraliomargarita parva]
MKITAALSTIGILMAAGVSLPAEPSKVAVATPLEKDRPFDFNEEATARQQATLVALGKKQADLLLSNVTLLNVHLGIWEENQDIVVSGERIAWVGDHGTYPGTAKETVDLTGRWAVPGFGESHKHIESSHVTPEYEAPMVLSDGNTWTVEGSHEMSNVIGMDNHEFWLLAEEAGSPQKVFVGVGSATPPTAFEMGGGYYGYEEMKHFMEDDLRVLGLDEVMDWSSVWNPEMPGYRRLWEMMQATWESRGVVEGHGSGLVAPDAINAFAAAGLSSDHGVTLAEEGWEKLSRGVFLQLKPDALPKVIPYLIEQGLKDWSHTSVSTDDRDVAASLELGTMDYNVRMAIDSGAPIETAYAMASLYPARHWHVEHLVGSLAPGRYADVVVLSDPATVAIEEVYVNGVLAYDDGKYLLGIPEVTYPEWAYNTVNIGRELTADDFVIPAPEDGGDTATAALLEMFYFEEDFKTAELPIVDGAVQRDSEAGITKCALVDRYHGNAQVGKMFWRGVGPKTPNSAVACSISHDLHNVWSLGSSDEAMAKAVNAVAELGGGWALVREGEVVATVKYEVGGLMSQRSAEAVAAELEVLYEEADQMEWLGAPGLPKRMIFAYLTCTPWKWVLVAPYEGNEQGLVNVTTGATHPVVW